MFVCLSRRAAAKMFRDDRAAFNAEVLRNVRASLGLDRRR
jgi:hypothetical protein